jgi:hypothetical protein
MIYITISPPQCKNADEQKWMNGSRDDLKEGRESDLGWVTPLQPMYVIHPFADANMSFFLSFFTL